MTERHETGIQWTHVPGYIGATWNPTTGCTRVSPGCDHCYAFTLHDQRHKANLDAARAHPVISLRDISHGHDLIAAKRREDWAALPFPTQYDVPFSTVQVLDEKRLTEPLRKRKPHAYFVDSMADLFHEDVPDEALLRIFKVMDAAPQHLFMILTKRPHRMRQAVKTLDIWGAQLGVPWPLPNVWLGVSTEDQERADERIPLLLDTPAAVRFVSYEPALGSVDFGRLNPPTSEEWANSYNALDGTWANAHEHDRAWPRGLDWIIVGGESGSHARPFDLAWARSVVAQGAAAGVPVFYKQGGASNRCSHSQHGSHFDCFPDDLKVREFPHANS